MSKRYFEFVEGKSQKFWEIAIVGTTVITTYGRLGSEGQVTEKGESSVERAQKLYDRLVREKTGKGYAEKTAGAGGKATAPAKGRAKSAPAKPAKPAAAKRTPAKPADTARRFECTEDGSSKFWEIRVARASHTVRFGKLGTAGQEKTKSFAGAAEAAADAAKLVAEKTKKGYVEVGGGSASARGATSGKPVKPAKAGKAAGAPADDGAPKEIVELRRLALAAREAGDAMTRTYLLVGGKPSATARGVMRAGGAPIGVTSATRPKKSYEREDADSEYMHHLVTLDLDAMPELRAAHRKLAKARALAMFIDDAMDNEAFDEDTHETAVVILKDEDIARGEWQGPKVGDPKARPLSAWPVDVPSRVFAYDPWGGDEEPDEGAPLHQLYEQLMSSNRAGGGLIDWSGNIEDDEGWLFQFTEDIVDVNLGDAGTMYVFLDRAFWCGH